MARKRGAPPYQPTDEAREKVREYTAVGVPQTDIAAVLGISVNTLKKYFPDELTVAGIEATAAVAGKLYEQCMDGNTTAIIFWLKTKGGWSETSHIKQEHTVKSGVMVVPAAVAPDEWAETAAKYQRKLKAISAESAKQNKDEPKG